ncbi:unnamed protein product [Protopolystoma xenopodis]|uniref:Uncharacterized protein n=1 Tax=Protopolystoma xenopodis TaxID=117903 RepID=A0A448WTA5_9PLAT|nr:unnamed protein product [Protopolystoma xenopodis]
MAEQPSRCPLLSAEYSNLSCQLDPYEFSRARENTTKTGTRGCVVELKLRYDMHNREFNNFEDTFEMMRKPQLRVNEMCIDACRNEEVHTSVLLDDDGKPLLAISRLTVLWSSGQPSLRGILLWLP